MKCLICKRKLGPKHAAAGIGPVCARKQRDAGDRAAAVRITFLSSPRTTRRDNRSYLYRVKGEPSSLVRIFPDDAGDGRVATCDCFDGKRRLRCHHVNAVSLVDKKKFY